jgi:tol-pal system protein YbgF
MWIVILAATLVSFTGCVIGQKGPDPQIEELKNRMAKVETDSAQTKQVVDQNLGTMADNILTFDNMQQEFEQMRGTVQESKFVQDRNNKQYQALKTYLDTQFEKLDKRLLVLERQAGIKTDPSLALGPVPTNLDKVPVGQKPEKGMFEEAMLNFKQKKYSVSHKKFVDFLKTYPGSEVADQAQYYVGESLFQQKNYAEAILAYEELNTKYPKSKFAPAAVLNQAISFEQMGEKVDAKLFYEKVISDYPKSPEAKIAQKKLALFKK